MFLSVISVATLSNSVPRLSTSVDRLSISVATLSNSVPRLSVSVARLLYQYSYTVY